jgi:hypothetical protein
MSNQQATFVELCLAGEVDDREIDDFVDRWHEGNDARGLGEFLGMTEEEYEIWVERPESLRSILFARRHQMPLAEALALRDD